MAKDKENTGTEVSEQDEMLYLQEFMGDLEGELRQEILLSKKMASSIRPTRRRRISPQAGQALEILGHAIDYLIDEYVYSGGTFTQRDSQIEAIHLLVTLNRQVYFECPKVPTLMERFRALLHLPAA